MKNILYKNYTSKWQKILTVTHLIYAIVFTCWIILIRVYNSSFATIFISAMVLGVGLSVLKLFAVKKIQHKSLNEIKNH